MILMEIFIVLFGLGIAAVIALAFANMYMEVTNDRNRCNAVLDDLVAGVIDYDIDNLTTSDYRPEEFGISLKLVDKSQRQYMLLVSNPSERYTITYRDIGENGKEQHYYLTYTTKNRRFGPILAFAKSVVRKEKEKIN